MYSMISEEKTFEKVYDDDGRQVMAIAQLAWPLGPGELKIQLSMSSNATCSCHDISENFLDNMKYQKSDTG
jgi:hypothetical protein